MRFSRFALLFLLVPFLALGGAPRRMSDPQALTETAPSGTVVTSGVHFPLDDLNGFRITICADSGQTLTNVTVDQYYFDSNSGAPWSKNPSLTLTVTAASVRCVTFPDQAVSAAIAGSYVMAVSNGTTVSGGTVTIYYQGFSVNR